jgi:drug/metabolite transporter (DMT)-like permease
VRRGWAREAARGPRMQLMQDEPARRRRLGATRLPLPRSARPASTALNYKSDAGPLDRLDEQPVAVGELPPLPPLDWVGKPADSFKRLFSDYAPRMDDTQAFLWLLAVVALCGINFPLTTFVGESFDASTLLTMRFAIAIGFFLPWLKDIEKEIMPAGVETGTWLAAGYIAQAVALTGGTNAGVASFFASMSCVLCPFFERAVGVKLNWRAWAAAATGLAGAAVLELGPGILDGSGGAAPAMPSTPELIALLQPFFFGFYLFRTEIHMQKYPEQAMTLTALQVIVTTALCGAWGLSLGGVPELGDVLAQASDSLASLTDAAELQSKLPALLGLLWMGLLPSGLSLALETVIVHKLSSSVTALTFTLEPVFAAVFGSLMLHEEFGASTAVGGALAIAAVLIRCAEPEQLKVAWKDTADTIKARLKPKNT